MKSMSNEEILAKLQKLSQGFRFGPFSTVDQDGMRISGATNGFVLIVFPVDLKLEENRIATSAGFVLGEARPMWSFKDVSVREIQEVLGMEEVPCVCPEEEEVFCSCECGEDGHWRIVGGLKNCTRCRGTGLYREYTGREDGKPKEIIFGGSVVDGEQLFRLLDGLPDGMVRISPGMNEGKSVLLEAVDGSWKGVIMALQHHCMGIEVYKFRESHLNQADVLPWQLTQAVQGVQA